jgi:lytic murein transglycosylase
MTRKRADQAMQTTRRGLLLGLSALSLSACIGGAPGGGGFAPRGPEAPLPFAANPGFDAWVAGFRDRAAARGIPAATLAAAFRGAGFIPGVVERDRNQTEFTRTLEDYLSIAASDERIAKGRAAMARYGSALNAVSARYGVEPQVIAAVWGLESFYGERRGNVPVISALATLAYDGRRREFFESQLMAALRILANGDITPDRMTGSWAGAMGHTQFIPTSYLAHAVDFTGDGRRDIWSEDPTDALASTAAYLAAAGWQRGVPWGLEVSAPAGIGGGTQSSDGWAAAGVTRAGGGALPALASATLIRPGGPAFLITRNFQAILRYNNAQSYAIGVGHLSDRLIGGAPIRGPFPPDAQGLSKADRQDIQRLLTAQGFDTGGTDGVIGTRTKTAIEAYEARNGLPITGLATADLLRRLRA